MGSKPPPSPPSSAKSPAPAKRYDPYPRVAWLLGIVGVLVLLSLFVPSFDVMSPGERRRAKDQSIVGAIRTFNTGAVTYYTTYGNGYPPDLESFGPPPEGGRPDCNYSNLVHSDLAKGEKSGYRFFYLPGKPVESAGPGCDVPGVESYSILARPIRFGIDGRHNYFTDQTGISRYTEEDRRATCNDAPTPDQISQAGESRSPGRLHIDNPVAGLLRLRSHAVDYKAGYLNGYPPDLQSLGPSAEIKALSCDHAGFRFGSRWRDPGGVVRGYRFEYRPGPPVETPGPCCSPGALSFSALARPVRWTPRLRNYYIDQTGVIRYTEEDREATADDPPVDLKRRPLR